MGSLYLTMMLCGGPRIYYVDPTSVESAYVSGSHRRPLRAGGRRYHAIGLTDRMACGAAIGRYARILAGSIAIERQDTFSEQDAKGAFGGGGRK